MRPLGLAVLATVALALPARSQTPMQVMESFPAARSVMRGAATDVFVRFSDPVDHAHSTLDIEQDGKLVRRVAPRLNSQPNVLYASVGKLDPGSYALHWKVLAARDHAPFEGTIAFSVIR